MTSSCPEQIVFEVSQDYCCLRRPKGHVPLETLLGVPRLRQHGGLPRYQFGVSGGRMAGAVILVLSLCARFALQRGKNVNASLPAVPPGPFFASILVFPNAT